MRIMHLVLIHLSFIFLVLYLCVYRLLIVKAEVVVFCSLYSFFKVKLDKQIFCPVGVCLRLNNFFESFSAVWGMNLEENMLCSYSFV